LIEPAERRPLVLIVDDDGAVQQAVREELSHQSYGVVVTSDGDSAVRLIQALRPDVVVLDLILPQVSGAMVAATLRSLDLRPRLLLLTGLPEAHDIARELEADGVVEKPLVRADLRRAIERLILRK
jgi:CheY-like chemotaxis protein